MTIRAYPCFARKPARTRPKPRLAPVIRAIFWTMAGAEFIETVEWLQASPSKISFSGYKGYKTERSERIAMPIDCDSTRDTCVCSSPDRPATPLGPCPRVSCETCHRVHKGQRYAR